MSKIIVQDFLKSSWSCIETVVNELSKPKEHQRTDVHLFSFEGGCRNDITLDDNHVFLRTSVEYSNPQLTLEELQGIIAARLIETCGNHFHNYGLHQFDSNDIDAICEALTKAPRDRIFPFSLNVDEIEPDRYSANPLRESILTSGQSAFPCATVKTDTLEIDPKFVQKYEGILICKGDIEQINRYLKTSNNSYLDMVDTVKYEQLHNLSEPFGINLCINSMRLPLAVLEKEKTDGVLHQMIRETHKDYQSVEFVYSCMGRSMKNLTTLITVPHSKKGYASKRAAKGRLCFEGTEVKSLKVKYQTVLLYQNDVDQSDVSVARADDDFVVEGEKLRNYSFKETPSSPQFFLYSLMSPEDAVVWHGIGEHGAPELLKSYATTRAACATDSIVRKFSNKHGLCSGMPLQFNLVPKYMWRHPVHHNIDAGLGCISNLRDLADLGMKIEHLPASQYVRKGMNPSTSKA
jgi:hypothetical protein